MPTPLPPRSHTRSKCRSRNVASATTRTSPCSRGTVARYGVCDSSSRLPDRKRSTRPFPASSLLRHTRRHAQPPPPDDNGSFTKTSSFLPGRALLSTLESSLFAFGGQNYELLPFRVAVFPRLVHGRFHPLCPSEHHRRAARDAN